MTTKAQIRDFIAQKKIAVVGVSRKGNGFGNIALKELKGKGYVVYPVHPDVDAIGGERCYASLRALPEPVAGALIVVPPAQTERVVREAYDAGIRRVWMQQGAESEKAIAFCEQNEMSVVHGECILMFAEPAQFFHRAHRFVKGMAGQLPR